MNSLSFIGVEKFIPSTAYSLSTINFPRPSNTAELENVPLIALCINSGSNPTFIPSTITSAVMLL